MNKDSPENGSERKYYSIFASTDCLSEEQLLRYVRKELSPKEQHAVEMHLNDCELCSDAVEGFMLNQNPAGLHSLKREIPSLVTSFSRYENTWDFGSRKFWLAAASVALLLCSSVMFYYFSENQNADKSMSLAQQMTAKQKQLEEHAITKISTPEQATSENIKSAEEIKQEKRQTSGSTKDSKNLVDQSVTKSEPGIYKKQEQKPVYPATITKGAEDKPIAANPARNLSLAMDKSEAPKSPPPSEIIQNGIAESRSAMPAAAQKQAPVNADQAVMTPKSNAYKSVSQEEREAPQKESVTPKESDEPMALETVSIKRKEKGKQVPGNAPMAISARNVALDLFNDKKYSEANGYFSSNLSDPGSRLYSGKCFYYLNHSDSAINTLTPLLSIGDKKIVDEARWYLALSYLMKKDNEPAKKLLQALSDEKTEFKKPADKKLKELK